MSPCRSTRYQSFHFRKKLFYVVSSLILSVALMCTGVFDIVFVLVFQRPDLTTHDAMATIMILHIVAFYLSMFGFVHSFEAKLYILTKAAAVAGGLTVVSLILRIAQDMTLVGFYPNKYAVT